MIVQHPTVSSNRSYLLKIWVGVNYIGTCCGAAPHHVRAIAEALGREVPASRYSPDMTLHPALGTDVKRRDVPYLEDWRD